MNSQANVTFLALNGNHFPPARKLRLSTEHKTIEIGRASKNSSKGLSAAVDNAWFDSPVMSRKHAEIAFNEKSNAISIQDVGSMHGTWVNIHKLEAGESRVLCDGDTLVFGAEVTRGDETFPACSFKTNYDIVSHRSNTFTFPEASDIDDINKPNTFAYPEGSDLGEEDESYGFSEDDFSEKEDSLSEDDLSIESQPLKAAEIGNHIDLTRDDSPAPYSPVASAFENRVVGTASSPFDNAVKHKEGSAIKSGNAPIILDSDDEEEGFTTDSDNNSADDLPDEIAAHYDSDESIEEENSEFGNQESLIAVAGDAFSTSNDEEIPDSYSFEPLNTDSGANEKTGMNMKTLIEVPEVIMGYDDDEEDEDNDDTSCVSEYGISRVGQESLQMLHDDGLLSKIEDSPAYQIGKSIVVVGEPTNGIASAEKNNAGFAGLAWENPPNTNTYPSSTSIDAATLHPSSSTFNNLRQPSPSDAAMVKPAASTYQSGLLLNVMPSDEWQQLPQSLGNRSGKYAFFEAREHNKTALHSVSSDEVSFVASPIRTVGSSPEQTHQELKQQRAREEALKRFRETRRMTLGEPTPMDMSSNASIGGSSAPELYDPHPIIAALSSTPVPYLHDHKQAPPLPERSPSPEPDMTSAVKYTESRATMAAANKTAALFSGRSRLSINDIIDDSTADRPVDTLKRKAEDISQVVENEVRNWAASIPSDVSTKTKQSPGTESQPRDIAATEPRTDPATSEQQPAKRVRRIVEHLGYAALGGAAVGAGLFSFLVASAPDFM